MRKFLKKSIRNYNDYRMSNKYNKMDLDLKKQ